jgi:UDP-N-acetyl-2-amino-2-deoxyglucuronate dehydrogenase
LGTDVICEKPLVLNPWNVDVLQSVENETGKHVYNILQLRLHPAIVALKEKVDKAPDNIVYDVDLTYITSRGHWYYTSWKGSDSKSGGIATNIGIHFYDMLCHIFGEVQENIVHVATHDRVAGFIRFKKARVRYFLSINKKTLPKEVLESGKSTFRQLIINGEVFEFSDGFTDLHTESYRQILAGNGFGLDEVRPCIQIVYDIRNTQPVGLKGDYHPLATLTCETHPFAR